MIVSIIIPMFNAAATIESSVFSAINQHPVEGVKREIIVVDDGSTDTSYATVEKFINEGNLIKLVRQKNAGPAAARNHAVSLSCGDYILPLDADDMIRPDFIKKTLPLMTAGIGIVSTEMMYFGIENGVIPIKNRTYEEQLQSNEIPVTSLIDREAFLQAGGYRTDIDSWEDWFLWIEILARNWKMASINEPLFWYRRRENQFASVGWNKKEEYTEKIRRFHPDFLKNK
jgi:glycosyltransferase involved in cell wall biosynthesis